MMQRRVPWRMQGVQARCNAEQPSSIIFEQHTPRQALGQFGYDAGAPIGLRPLFGPVALGPAKVLQCCSFSFSPAEVLGVGLIVIAA